MAVEAFSRRIEVIGAGVTTLAGSNQTRFSCAEMPDGPPADDEKKPLDTRAVQGLQWESGIEMVMSVVEVS